MDWVSTDECLKLQGQCKVDRVGRTLLSAAFNVDLVDVLR